MSEKITPCYYPDYLQLDKILGAQELKSEKYGKKAHDEMLFIITHQAYEIWFKQIREEIYLLKNVLEKDELDALDLDICLKTVERVITIQKVLNEQIRIIETMTPQSFLTFRNYLVPASGFQSWQFREIEIRLGLKENKRVKFDKKSFAMRLEDKERDYLLNIQKEPSIYELVGKWLERIPFLEFENFSFWEEFSKQTQSMLKEDENIIKSNQSISEEERELQLANLISTQVSFSIITDKEKYAELFSQGKFDLSHRALLSALFIKLYSKYPILNLPGRLLESLVTLDELISTWRYTHFLMVNRMLGKKIGTGGSSGHAYLLATTRANRIFNDLFNISTYLIPEDRLPNLPDSLVSNLTYKA
ncbi:tryptophan 2,3-dioxygenase [Bacteriovoracaceae bacterium]|nr:tryptophan 2,3-dioxygenase [Bacteriovoracaceae bacterium]